MTAPMRDEDRETLLEHGVTLDDIWMRLGAIQAAQAEHTETLREHGADLKNLVHAQHTVVAELQAIRRAIDAAGIGS